MGEKTTLGLRVMVYGRDPKSDRALIKSFRQKSLGGRGMFLYSFPLLEERKQRTVYFHYWKGEG